MEEIAPTPKFDLLASNFPPLPGSIASTPGELVLESRMSDVVKGICKEKVSMVFKGCSVYLNISPLLCRLLPIVAHYDLGINNHVKIYFFLFE